MGPAVALLGPRRCGKTTLARQLAEVSKSTHFDLARLPEPMTALDSLRGLIVIDEVQRHPDLFPILRVLLDHNRFARDSSSRGAPRRSHCDRAPKRLAGRIGSCKHRLALEIRRNS